MTPNEKWLARAAEKQAAQEARAKAQRESDKIAKRTRRPAYRLWSDTVRDPLDEKDNLGESPDY